MSGAPGLGKTFLSACIAREVSNAGFSVVYDTADEILSNINLPLSDGEKDRFIKEYLYSKEDELMVTPKNIDALINRASVILARGINLAVHKKLDYKTVSDYIS